MQIGMFYGAQCTQQTTRPPTSCSPAAFMRQNSEQQDTRDRALMTSDLTAVCQPRDAAFPHAHYHVRYYVPGCCFLRYMCLFSFSCEELMRVIISLIYRR